MANYLTKGRLVGITGRLQARKYTTSDGSTREVVEIVAEQVSGLDRPKDGAPTTNTESVEEFDPYAED